MASFVFNVVDENEASIAAKFRFYHYNTNKYSNVRTTNDDKQIICDTDDADIDNQTALFSNGDVGLLLVWVGQDNTDGEQNRFAIMKIVSDGSDLYSGTVQLLPSVVPIVVANIENGLINEQINADGSGSYDDYSWTYNGYAHYHKASYYGKGFNNVGIAGIEYDWGNGYATNNVHTYTTVGNKQINVKVTNKYGQMSEVTKTIQVKYHQPSTIVSATPSEPQVNEDCAIGIDNNDIDSRIVQQAYKLDGVATNETTLRFAELGSHTYEVVTTWNDGYEDKTYSDMINIQLSNQNPTVNLIAIKNAANNYTIKSNASDPEGRMQKVIFDIYIEKKQIFEENPTSEKYVFIHSVEIVNEPYEMNTMLYLNEKYKINGTAYDMDGGVSNSSDVMIKVHEHVGNTETVYVETIKYVPEFKYVYMDPLRDGVENVMMSVGDQKMDLSFNSTKFDYNVGEQGSNEFNLQNETIDFEYIENTGDI